VTTADGYILTLHRIPYSPKSNRTATKRQIVFLQHGLLSSSVDWVIMGPDRALGTVNTPSGVKRQKSGENRIMKKFHNLNFSPTVTWTIKSRMR
jgi:hypothetical protein